jgi:hypothetical protein
MTELLANIVQASFQSSTAVISVTVTPENMQFRDHIILLLKIFQ